MKLIVIGSLHLQAPLHDALRVVPNGNWSYYMRDGIAAILHSRVGMLNYFFIHSIYAYIYIDIFFLYLLFV